MNIKENKLNVSVPYQTQPKEVITMKNTIKQIISIITNDSYIDNLSKFLNSLDDSDYSRCVYTDTKVDKDGITICFNYKQKHSICDKYISIKFTSKGMVYIIQYCGCMIVLPMIGISYQDVQKMILTVSV